MPHTFPSTAQSALIVGRTPRSWGPHWGRRHRRLAAVWMVLISLAKSGSRGTRADQGVRPTISAGFAALAKSMRHYASVGLVERVRHVEPGRDGGVRGVDLVGAPRDARDAGARLLLQDAGARPPLHGSGCAGAGGGVRNQRRADGAPHVAEGGRRAGRVPPDSSHAGVRVLSAARGGARGAGRDGAMAVVEVAARTAGGRWAARLRTLPGRRTHLVDAHGCTGCLTELGKPGNRSLRSSGSALLE